MRILSLTQSASDNLGDKAIFRVISEFYRKKGHEVIEGMFYPDTYLTIAEQNKANMVDGSIEENGWKRWLINNTPLGVVYQIRSDRNGKERVKRNLKIYWKELSAMKYDAILIGGGALVKHHHDFMWCMDFWCREAITPINIVGRESYRARGKDILGGHLPRKKGCRA